MLLASFIVPVYRIEECYLKECLDSLIAIQKVNVEFILIDDGSPDQSGAICDEYAKIDNRVLVMHKENEGVSATRNCGIQAAQGKYITFIDADDWIEPNEMDALLTELGETNYDICVFGQYIEFKGKFPLEIRPFAKDCTFTTDDELNKIRAMVFVRGYDTLKTSVDAGVFANVADKFIKRSILLEHMILFDTKAVLAEDAIFWMECMHHCSSVRYIDRCIYHYRMRLTSASHRNWENGYRLIAQSICTIENALTKYDSDDKLKEALMYRCYDLIFEQFSNSYIYSKVDILSGMSNFTTEMRNEPFDRAIRTVKYRYMDKKEIIKAVLLKNNMSAVLYFLMLLWRKRNLNENDEANFY